MLQVLYPKLAPGLVCTGPSCSAGLLAQGWVLAWFYAPGQDLYIGVPESPQQRYRDFHGKA